MDSVRSIDAAAAGVRDYIADQVDVLRANVPTALAELAGESVHDARVATRRLKSAIELLEPLVPRQPARKLNRAGRRIRRLLGPLRDIDVAIGHLNDLPLPKRAQPGRDWLVRHLREQHTTIEKSAKGHAADDYLKRFDRLAELLEQVDEVAPALRWRIAESAREQFFAFATDANALLEPTGASVDPHQVRIDGKRLRYTLEIALSAGVRLPKSLLRRFKKLQDMLGTWHDYVVLIDIAHDASRHHQLSHLSTSDLRALLPLIDLLTRRAEAELQRFKNAWGRARTSIEATLRKRFPLARLHVSARTAGDSGDADLAEKADPPAA
jgi:CHAD domain-containing protein